MLSGKSFTYFESEEIHFKLCFLSHVLWCGKIFPFKAVISGKGRKKKERVDVNRGRTRRRKQADKSQLRREGERMKEGGVDQNNTRKDKWKRRKRWKDKQKETLRKVWGVKKR